MERTNEVPQSLISTRSNVIYLTKIDYCGHREDNPVNYQQRRGKKQGTILQLLPEQLPVLHK